MPFFIHKRYNQRLVCNLIRRQKCLLVLHNGEVTWREISNIPNHALVGS